MIKRVLISGLTLFITTACFAQVDTIYFDQDWDECARNEAEYYRVLEKDDLKNQYTVRDFYLSDTLFMTGTFGEGEIYNGIFRYYYPNGKLKKKGVYDNSNKIGLWTYWYSNGQIKEQKLFRPGNPDEIISTNNVVINYWDSLGNHQVQSGTGPYMSFHDNGMLESEGQLKGSLKVGNWKGYWDDGNLYYTESYNKSGQLIQGESFDKNGNKYSYAEVSELPEHQKGMSGFYAELGKKVRYPVPARKYGIEGKVFVSFQVLKDGSLDDITVVKGIGGGCDEEAVRVVSRMKPFNPGLVRGQPVSIKMVLPIVFKLN